LSILGTLQQMTPFLDKILSAFPFFLCCSVS
jgi:hypothetical protein